VVNDNVANLVLEQTRRLDQRFSRMEDDMADIKLRMTTTEEHLGSLMTSVSGINARLDKLDAGVSRIERRLDLTETE
jgi:DNA anti-recombination protein RmuC